MIWFEAGLLSTIFFFLSSLRGEQTNSSHTGAQRVSTQLIRIGSSGAVHQSGSSNAPVLPLRRKIHSTLRASVFVNPCEARRSHPETECIRKSTQQKNKTLKSVTDHRMRLLGPIRWERAWNNAQSLQEEAQYPHRRDSASLRCIFIVNYILPQVMSKWQILLSGCEEACGDVVIAHGILAKRGFFNLFPSRQFHLARCEADAWRVRLHR